MEEKNYHYEWFAYTDNLTYGRQLLGHSRSKSEAKRIAFHACKGVWTIKKQRVYDK